MKYKFQYLWITDIKYQMGQTITRQPASFWHMEDLPLEMPWLSTIPLPPMYIKLHDLTNMMSLFNTIPLPSRYMGFHDVAPHIQPLSSIHIEGVCESHALPSMYTEDPHKLANDAPLLHTLPSMYTEDHHVPRVHSLPFHQSVMERYRV